MKLGRPGNETQSLGMRLGQPLKPHGIHNVPKSTATDVQQSLIVVKVKLCHIMMKRKSVCTELPNLGKKAQHSHSYFHFHRKTKYC